MSKMLNPPFPNNNPEANLKVPLIVTAPLNVPFFPSKFNVVPGPIDKVEKMGEPPIIEEIPFPTKLTEFKNIVETLVVKKPKY
jgi:hypothetical protein